MPVSVPISACGNRSRVALSCERPATISLGVRRRFCAPAAPPPAHGASGSEGAEQILATGTKPARWIARDALRELRSDAVQARLRG